MSLEQAHITPVCCFRPVWRPPLWPGLGFLWPHSPADTFLVLISVPVKSHRRSGLSRALMGAPSALRPSHGSAAAVLSQFGFVIQLEALERMQLEKTEGPKVCLRKKETQCRLLSQACSLDPSLGLGLEGGGEMKIGARAMKSLAEWVHRQKGTWPCFLEAQMY